jgi:RNA polymerase sigma-70 factor (ECF subfamily)
MRGASATELEVLYRSRYRHFVRVATAIVGSDERAIDVVQEAFATALRRRRAFRGEGPLEAWLWRIVVNTSRREAARPVPQPLPDEHAATASPNGSAASIRDAVAALPERQRHALFLRYYADLDYAAIAQALEIQPGTVAATLNAAHNKLRTLLQEAHR